MKKILLMAIAVIFISCESRTYEDISVIATNPTYEANVKPVINAECLSCHYRGSAHPWDTYERVKDAAQNGKLLCKINGQCGVMPPSGKLPQLTVDMINLWAQQGYVEK
jgi:hypothetical protein